MRRPNAKQTVLGLVVVSIGKTHKRPMETTQVETGTGLFKSNHCSSYQKNDNSVWDRKRIPCQIPFFSPQINCIQDLLPPPTNHPRGNSHPITLLYLLYIFTSKWVMHSLFAGQNMLLHVFLFCTFLSK